MIIKYKWNKKNISVGINMFDWGRKKLFLFVWGTAFSLICFSFTNSGYAKQKYFVAPTKITDWEISCSVDKGAITGKGANWVFKTSKNKCEGGTFNQRAEISSKKAISTSTKAIYNFQSLFKFTSFDYDKQFDIFQVHDGRYGCAPPLKVSVNSRGKVRLYSDYTTGPNQCKKDVIKFLSPGETRIKRDGTQYKLDVYLSFNGDAGFLVDVYIDDKLQVSGKYNPPSKDKFVSSRYYYFKHGVYSKKIFDFKLESKMSMTKISALPPKRTLENKKVSTISNSVSVGKDDGNAQEYRLLAKKKINSDAKFRNCLLAENIPKSHLSTVRFKPAAEEVPMILDKVRETKCFINLAD